MRIICATILATTLITIFLYSYKKNKDIFSPLCIFSLFQFLRYVPNMASAEIDNRILLTNENVLKTFWIEMVFVMCVCVSYALVKKDKNQKYYVKKNNNIIPFYVIVLLFMIGMMCRIQLINRYGGIMYIYNNMHSVYMQQGVGSGFRTILEKSMLIAIMMQLERLNHIGIKKTKRSIINIFGFMLMIILYVGSYLIFSSRSPALELIMIVVFGYNYIFKKIRISNFFNVKSILIIVVMLFIIVVMPMLRSKNMVEDKELNVVDSLFDEFSYLGRDTKVYEHFNYDNYWMGKSYLGLATAFIPSSIYENKPVVDDGVYLCNIIYGYDYEPLKSLDEVRIKYSFPFSTQGSTYANFGIVGVILGGFIMGILFAKTYKILLDTRNIWIVILYQLIVYQFELSVLSISQTLIYMIGTYFVYKMITGMKIIKYKENLSNVS